MGDALAGIDVRKHSATPVPIEPGQLWQLLIGNRCCGMLFVTACSVDTVWYKLSVFGGVLIVASGFYNNPAALFQNLINPASTTGAVKSVFLRLVARLPGRGQQ